MKEGSPVPDTHCSRLGWRLALLPDGCAMISYSVGHRAKLLFTLRVAAHSAPMMGINRSNLSRRTILLLLVLLGMPLAARSATLEDSAKELARKIAAGLPARGDLSCEIRNTSSLWLDDVVRIEQALKTELDGRCVRTQANGSETAKIVVTLSENVKTLVWTAEIRQGAEYRELLQPVPRSTGLLSSTKALPIVLNSERFWDGPERVLDVELVTAPNGDQLTVMLLPDAVFIRNTSRGSETELIYPLWFPHLHCVKRLEPYRCKTGISLT